MYRLETIISEDGKLVLDDLPFRAGNLVTVSILELKGASEGDRYPLRGEPVEYLNPTDPLEL